MRLALRRGVVVEAGDPAEPMQKLAVEVAGARRPAVSDTALHGAARTGDEVVVNIQAVELGLGSGGFDVLHVNLTRGLAGTGEAGAHVMKLGYTSLQHAIHPLEEGRERLRTPLGAPVAACLLHGQLAPLAHAFARAAPGARLGYVQTEGGALPGRLSETVRELRTRGLLAGHVSAGAAHGGEREAVTVAGALHAGFTELDWHAAVCAPGPGILGSGSALGHGGLYALDALHAALALGCPAVLAPRRSSADPRARHRGLAHHTRTVLALLLAPVTVPLAGAEPPPDDRHDWRPTAPPDLDGYATTGLPARHMGRSLEEDPDFFAAALQAGDLLAQALHAAA